MLLDTNALLWWLVDSPRLDAAARALIADPAHDILVSVVSLWEIVIKVRIGKLQIDLGEIEEAIASENFHRLAIAPDHLKALRTLPSHHRDPFDHLLIAQAISENAIFLTSDRQAQLYPVRVAVAG
ncbi:type II toxin-antitoxin system VapC family toxin [Caulobacter sp. DWP3-1-3b2]|uniref:type II toxin-antitoxin system VapC family toxin n=1 Tax=Caulobacter sp. DWP3-1-3b2 TaxID=2804643 RepID=UPI003CEEF5DB